ncbi:MAG: Crp/Fnr family transcriptional regulator [Pseudomonadota bacterium]
MDDHALPNTPVSPRLKGLGGPWQGLADEAFEALVENAAIQHVDRDSQMAPVVGIVMSGILGVARTLSDGRRVYCALFHGGDLVDIRRADRDAQGALTAVTDVDVVVVDARQFDHLTETHPALAQTVIAELRGHFARLRDHCTDLACKTPVERLACALLEFRRWPEAHVEDQRDTIRLPIRQSDIADYIGVTPATVSRTVRKLAEEHLIRLLGRDSVELTDLPALRMLANGGRPRRSTRT